MGKFDRRSRDQKRKAKLQKEAKRSRKHVSMAYYGNKYKTKRFLAPLFQVETGILETYIISDRQLTDDTVVAALERLIGQLRSASPPSFDASPEGPGDEKDIIIFNIRRNWRRQPDDLNYPTRDEWIGVIRTILGSIENRTTPSSDSQGYLHYLEGFMDKIGVIVQEIDEDLTPLSELDADPLMELGRLWLAGDRRAELEFPGQARRLIGLGEAERVIEVCQHLVSETNAPVLLGTLGYLCREAKQALA